MFQIVLVNKRNGHRTVVASGLATEQAATALIPTLTAYQGRTLVVEPVPATRGDTLSAVMHTLRMAAGGWSDLLHAAEQAEGDWVVADTLEGRVAWVTPSGRTFFAQCSAYGTPQVMANQWQEWMEGATLWRANAAHNPTPPQGGHLVGRVAFFGRHLDDTLDAIREFERLWQEAQQ